MKEQDKSKHIIQHWHKDDNLDIDKYVLKY